MLFHFKGTGAKSNRLLSGAVLLTATQVACYGLSFTRNLIVARTLTKVDYGVATLLGMALMVLELGGRMGFGQQVIQSRQGDSPEFQGTAQAFQFLAGACSAVLLAGMSGPMARLFDAGEIWWAFAMLAAVPLFQGLNHLDAARRQREYDYMPFVMMELVPQIIITLAVWPLTAVFGDFRVILWMMVGKAVLTTAISFVFAKQPYRWDWNAQNARSMLSFGWPLILNSLVMFGCQQADQLLVGAAFSLELLASYGLAFSLVSIPWFVFGQVGSSLMLPLLSRVEDYPDRFARQYRNCVQVGAVTAVGLTLPLMIGGEQLIVLLYGEKYRGTGQFVAVLGAGFMLRFLRFAPAVAAIAMGDTKNQLYSNLWRGVSLPLAFSVWGLGGSAVQIACCAVIGEIVATAASVLRLRIRQNVPIQENAAAIGYMLIFLLAGFLTLKLGIDRMAIQFAAIAAVAAFVISVFAAWVVFPEVSRLWLRVLYSEGKPT